jgi:hypothetical protein
VNGVRLMLGHCGRNFWEPQLVEARIKALQVAGAYEELCEDLCEDLNDLAYFIQVKELPYKHEKEDKTKMQEDYEALIHRQIATIRQVGVPAVYRIVVVYCVTAFTYSNIFGQEFRALMSYLVLLFRILAATE